MFIIKDTNKGKGLFADSFIAKGMILTRLSGKYLFSDLADPIASANLLQIDKSTYLDLEGFPEFFINHSCNPNVKIKILGNQVALVAIRNINSNEELSFDYSSTSTDDKEKWCMTCKCSEWNCRKDISGFKYLNKSQKDYLYSVGAVPDFITKEYSEK